MMRSVGVQRSRSLNRDRSTPSRPADANVDSAVAFDRIRLRSTIPIIDDRFMRDDALLGVESLPVYITRVGGAAAVIGSPSVPPFSLIGHTSSLAVALQQTDIWVYDIPRGNLS